MTRIVINLVLLAAAVYFYLSSNYFAAGCSAALFLFSVLQNRIAKIISVLRRLDTLPEEHRCNTVLVCRFSVKRALSHPSVENVFRSLKAQGKIHSDDFGGWIDSLTDNYKRKYKRDGSVEEVRFNIKGSLLFKNGEVDFSDVLYHQLSVPYEYVEGQEEGEEQRGMFTDPDEVGLEVRLLVVNGMLVLQVGEFSKKHSPKVIKEGSLSVYETWGTVSAFPLMYFSHRHGLPVRYLNLTSHATDSYKASLSSLGDRKRGQGRSWKRKPSEWADWDVLQQEVAAYRILCDDDSTDYSSSTVKRLSAQFEAKRDGLLKTGGFKEIWGSHGDDESWRYPDRGEDYGNGHMWVSFQDLNLLRDEGAQHWLTDYYEELP